MKHTIRELREYNAAVIWQNGRRISWTPAMRVALDVSPEVYKGDLFFELSQKPYRLESQRKQEKELINRS